MANLIAGSQTVTCNYFEHWFWGYACELDNISYLIQNEVFLIEGEHLSGYNDSAVLVVFTTASNMSYIPEEILFKFDNVESLLLSQSRMQSIDGAFEKCGNIQTMTFYRNELTSIQPQAFGTCSELTSLDLSENRITILPRDVFERNTKLESLIFSGNPIKVIEPELFRTLINLKILWLLDLDVAELDFRFYTNLKMLERSGAGSRFPNNITIIRSGTFKSMPALQSLQLINDNQEPMVIEDGAFEDLPDFNHLVLTGNAIEKLQTKSFINVENLLWFSVENNQITEIERDFFTNFPKLQQFNTIENPCGNKSYYFESGFEVEYLPDFEECFNKYENLTTSTSTTSITTSTTTTSTTTSTTAATTATEGDTTTTTTQGSSSLASISLIFLVMSCGLATTYF